MALEEPEVRAGRNVEGLAVAPLSQHKPPHENAADQQYEQHDGDHADHVEQIDLGNAGGDGEKPRPLSGHL